MAMRMIAVGDRIRADRAERRARALDRRRDKLRSQVDVLQGELDRERDARRELATMLERREEDQVSKGHPMLRMLVVGGGAYLLGAHAGRERYDQIMGAMRDLRAKVRGGAGELPAGEPARDDSPL